ncbi:MAG: peptidylprolyl isomerase [Polyangiaceae bacterium]|nr:peptidylprolyl isomerase [Polyangiaceae bacterium]
MLDFFRQKGLTSIVYGAIVIGMVLVFVLGFNPSAGKKLGSVNEACVARVKGSCIEPKAHRAAYRLIFARGTGGMKQSTASRVVLEGLIERELLVEDAARLGLTVSEDEITDSIFHGLVRLSVPSDNVMLSRNLGIDDGRIMMPFTDPKTKQFDLKTYERIVKQYTGRSPKEFREWQSRELLAAKVRDLVRVPVRVADSEAFDRYVEERTNASVNYVVVRRSWLEKYAIAESAKDIDAWAKDKVNLAQVKVPVRHILIAFGGTKDEDKAAAKKKAEDILDRVKKGEDFAKLAKEFSADPGSKDNGGQYPGEAVENFVAPFQKAVASVKPGELVADLVETQFGYHIIKRDDASKDDIAKTYKQNRSLELSKQVAQKIANDIKSGVSGDDAVKAAIAQYGVLKPPAPKAATANPADAGAAGADAGQAATPEAPPSADTDPERPQFLSSSAFNRRGTPIPGLSGEAAESVTQFAFRAKPSDVSDPIRGDDGFVVVKLKERTPATRADFDKERDLYKADMLAAKQAEALAFYVRRLREAAKGEVKVDEANMFGAKTDAGPQEEDEGP